MNLDEKMKLVMQDSLGTQVAFDQAFMSGGLDSISLLEFVRSISDAFKLQIPTTLVFDHPTIDSLI